MITQAMVTESLDIAIDENGFDDILQWTPEQIADDLCSYDSSFEGVPPGEIIPFIMTYLEKRQ